MTGKRARPRIVSLLDAVTQALADRCRGDFFPALVDALADGLSADYVVLARISETDTDVAVPVAFRAPVSDTGDMADDLAGLPYREVIRDNVLLCPADAGDRFPDAGFIQKHDIRGYLGRAIRDGAGRPRAVLSVMSRDRIADGDDAVLVTGFLSGRILAEMMLDECEEKHALQQRQLMNAGNLEAIGLLAGGVAHDFNNILSTVIGFSGLALRRLIDDTDSKLAGYLDEIFRAGVRGRDLAEQLMVYSRGTAGHPHPMDIEPLVMEMMKFQRAVLPETIELRQELVRGLPKAMIEPVALYQTMIRLVIRACGAMDNHGVLAITSGMPDGAPVECSYCHQQTGNGFIELAISDSAPPVTMAEFESQTCARQCREDGAATGRLLSLHDVLHDTGAHIQVRSLAGRGTQVRLLLPVAG